MASRLLDDDQIHAIVDTVSRTLSDELASITLPPPELRTPPSLAVSLSAITGATSQAEALEALLTGATSFGARAALFVVKQDAAHGWRGEGFDPTEDGSELVAGRVLSTDESAVRAAIEGTSVSCGGTDPEYPRIPDFGQEGALEARVEPIRVRDKVLGLLYVDRISEEAGWDPVAIEALSRVTEVAVERLALARGVTRSQPGKSAAPHRAHQQPHPGSAAAAAAPQPEAGSGRQSDPSPGYVHTSGEPEDTTREDARRFARLLMEELLLYYESDVEAGRAALDLEHRLGDRIDEARKMFDQRYANVLDDHDAVFRGAMIEVLAAGHEEALGSSSSART
jgi:hypothetical protein